MKNLQANDPLRLKAAYKDLGIKEVPGKKDNPRIMQMFDLSGYPGIEHDETAWCAAAMGAWLEESGHKGTGKLTARSYMKWGKETKNPKRGDLAVFKRGNSTWQGHVGFYLGEDTSRVYIIGGNQSDAVTVSSQPKTKLLGYRKPVTVANSKNIKVASLAGTAALVGLSDLTEYIPNVVNLSQMVEPSTAKWLLMAGVLGLAAFFIYDRYIKIRDYGV